MKLAQINEVIKASPAIQIQSKISLMQRRAWNVLLANAYNELPDKDIHSVSMIELAAKLDFNSGNQEYLTEVLKSIVVGDKLLGSFLQVALIDLSFFGHSSDAAGTS